jgi:membrane-associated phospholipid phosphatase
MTKRILKILQARNFLLKVFVRAHCFISRGGEISFTLSKLKIRFPIDLSNFLPKATKARGIAHQLFVIIVFMICIHSSNTYAKTGVQKAGDVFRYLSPAAAAVGSIYMEDFKGLGQLAISVFATQGISELMKKTIPEKRPDWKPGNPKNSFPSGHVASTFSAASYLRIRYDNPYVYAPAYAIAVFTAYSRVKPKRHRVIDVVAGAALAEAVSYFAVSRLNNVQTAPIISLEEDRQIIGLSLKF